MIVVGAHTFENHNGYGRWARSIVASLGRLGFNTWLAPGMIPIPADLKHLEKRAKPDILVYPPFTRIEAPIQFTTYESTKLTDRMVKELKKRRKVVVLSSYNKEMCENSGIKAEVCHPCVNVKYDLPKDFSPFVFTHIGADNGVPERKRTKDVILAFHKAFPVEHDVRLVVKKSPEDQRIANFDSRIELHFDNKSSLEEIYRATHVGVFPCGQEGWGYCQSELMAIGRPVIVPIYGGPKDFCNGLNAYSLPYHMVKTPKSIYHGDGLCARVNIKDLVKAFRWCYENKDDTVLRGCMAYRTMLGFSESRMDARIKAILESV